MDTTYLLTNFNENFVPSTDKKEIDDLVIDTDFGLEQSEKVRALLSTKFEYEKATLIELPTSSGKFDHHIDLFDDAQPTT